MSEARVKVLVAGIGNIFKGDDGFGVEVARRLAPRIGSVAVRVEDFGIRGLDLAYRLLDHSYQLVVLIDVVRRGHPPGTVYLIEPELENPAGGWATAQTHGMHPAQVLQWVKVMGGEPGPIRLVACEPETIVAEHELAMGLSPAVQAAVDQAMHVAEELVRDALCMS